MKQSILDKLQENHFNKWTQRHGHKFHAEAKSKCQGDEVHVNDQHGDHAFICCSDCGLVEAD